MESKFPLKTLAYACLLLAAPLVANAAGLGKLTVNSSLGQPLRAEIDLVSVQKDELDSVAARIASLEAFNQAHIDRAGILSSIRVSVERRPNGEPYVKLTSLQPVNDPFLDMLIQLDWSSGRLVREYTVLLDPPGFSDKESVAPVEAPSVKVSKVVAPAPAPQRVEAMPPAAHKPAVASSGKAKPVSKPVSVKKQPAPAQAKEAPSIAEQTFPKFVGGQEVAPTPVTPKQEQTTYEVKKGDTLAKIAREVKPEGFSLDQMLVALYNTNKNAFAGNMNRLKTGQILRVPDEQKISEVNQPAATKVVKAQAADWNAYRQKLASAVAEEKPAEQAEQQVSTGKITTAIEEKGPAPKEAPTDVLKLSKGEAPGAGKGAGAGGGKDLKTLQDRVQAMQEEATAKDKTIADANSRIAALQKNIADMQNLLDIRNKEMAELQKQAQVKTQPSTAPTPITPPAEQLKPAVPEQPAVTPLVKAVPEPVVATPPAPPKPEAKPAPKKPTPPSPVEEPTFMDTIMGNPIYMGGGALAVVGALVAALWAIGKRRRKALASFEDSIMTGGDLKTNTVFGNTAGGTIDTGDTSFLTDFSQAGMGAIDTNDVDPIAEAEVYMAYGRDAQAEEILKEAMSKDPNRHEIQLKLLEIYSGRKNVTAFETLAAELYAATGGNGPVWEKAAELGRALDSHNPLYGGGDVPAAMEEAVTPEVPEIPVEQSAPEISQAEPAPSPEMVEPAEEEDVTSALDLSLDMDTITGSTPETAEQPVAEEESPLDFSLEEPVEAESEAEAVSKPDEGMLEFNLDTIMPSVAEAEVEAEVTEKLEEPEATVEVPEEKSEPDTLQFETTVAEAPTLDLSVEPETGTEEISLEAPAEEDMGLDFDFNLDKELEASPPPVAEESKPSELLPDLDLGNINLNLDETPTVAEAADTIAGGDEQWEESATKLDLAKAYVEMGDKEGAREILQEVLEEGGPEQKDSAQKLMATL